MFIILLDYYRVHCNGTLLFINYRLKMQSNLFVTVDIPFLYVKYNGIKHELCKFLIILNILMLIPAITIYFYKDKENIINMIVKIYFFTLLFHLRLYINILVYFR